MSLPDDLSPAERAQLARLTDVSRELESAAYVPVESEEPESEEMATEQPNIKSDRLPSSAVTAMEFINHRAWLDLGNGDGEWRSYRFNLSADELKAVHRICAAAIATKLTQEIERVRNDLD